MYSVDVMSDTLLTYMIWIHFAILAVPMMIATMKFEWDEVKEQKRTSQQRRVLRPRVNNQQAPKPIPI